MDLAHDGGILSVDKGPLTSFKNRQKMAEEEVLVDQSMRTCGNSQLKRAEKSQW